ncbi:uncharacterized protein BJ212DRAFT_1529055, partial [Suillus subaureus]
IAETIDIIKHYTKLPDEIVDDLAGIIDNPENGRSLDIALHRGFDSYTWCLQTLQPTVWLGFCRKISGTYTLERTSCTNTKCNGYAMSLCTRRISRKCNSGITLEMVFRFPTLRSLRSILRLLMSYTSVALQKS